MPYWILISTALLCLTLLIAAFIALVFTLHIFKRYGDRHLYLNRSEMGRLLGAVFGLEIGSGFN